MKKRLDFIIQKILLPDVPLDEAMLTQLWDKLAKLLGGSQHISPYVDFHTHKYLANPPATRETWKHLRLTTPFPSGATVGSRGGKNQRKQFTKEHFDFFITHTAHGSNYFAPPACESDPDGPLAKTLSVSVRVIPLPPVAETKSTPDPKPTPKSSQSGKSKKNKRKIESNTDSEDSTADPTYDPAIDQGEGSSTKKRRRHSTKDSGIALSPAAADRVDSPAAAKSPASATSPAAANFSAIGAEVVIPHDSNSDSSEPPMVIVTDEFDGSGPLPDGSVAAAQEAQIQQADGNPGIHCHLFCVPLFYHTKFVFILGPLRTC